MKNFSRGGGGGGGGFNRPQMHQTVCSSCGQSCQVPFRPSGDRPVLCSTCFGAKGGGDNNRDRKFSGGNNDRRDRKFSGGNEGGRERTFQGGGDNLKGQIDSLNIKLDKILQLLDKTPEKKEVKKIVVPEKVEKKVAVKTVAKKKVVAKKKK